MACSNNANNGKDRLHKNQLFLIDTSEVMTQRIADLEVCIEQETIAQLEDMLCNVNLLAEAFDSVTSVIQHMGPRMGNISIVCAENRRENARTHNLPECHSEIAVAFLGNTPPFDFNLVVYLRATRLIIILLSEWLCVGLLYCTLWSFIQSLSCCKVRVSLSSNISLLRHKYIS